ncbi:putative membrane protein [Collimonas fungivorans]|uniref:Putative membrane protein n=1 Tax=Collimonas fungivorans TaxID=158899 RepID=A0A127PCU8_9BURK|nr:putative membrane protein [Collimonas fungivorans]
MSAPQVREWVKRRAIFLCFISVPYFCALFLSVGSNFP